MNKRERVMAAIKGQPVDRVPFSLWLHDFSREYSSSALAEETIRLYEAYDWDFLKPQSRPYCFNELWGQQFLRSRRSSAWPVVTHYGLEVAEEIASLPTPDVTAGALDEQLRAYQAVKAHVGPDVPVVATVFSPLMVAGFMMANGAPEMRRLMTAAPAMLEKGLQTIAEALEIHVRRCVGAGIDGIFYATTAATRDKMNARQFDRFERRFAMPILNAAQVAPFNIVHMCGDGILAEEFVNFPVSVFSWATTSGNPSLSKMHNLTGRAVLGGLPGKPGFGRMTAQAIQRHARRSLDEMKGRFHLLGPDCSVNPGVDPDLLEAVTEVAADFASNVLNPVG
jgi:uroporphyrinogen decarboxylase